MDRMSHLDHKATSPVSVRCYVLTISDTRVAGTDTSGRAIAELLESARIRHLESTTTFRYLD